MILQVLFYAKPETFVLKCKFNSKSLAFPLSKFLAAMHVMGKAFNMQMGA